MAQFRATRISVAVAAMLAIGLLGAACGSGADPTSVPTAQTSPPTGFPPSFPYIFEGNFTVAGQPGPAGVQVFARIGDARSQPAAAPRPGYYNNIVVGPLKTEDIDKPITFHLGDPDGASVQANETHPFNVVGRPTNFEFDLSFSSLP